jgi:hypothetical protein
MKNSRRYQALIQNKRPKLILPKAHEYLRPSEQSYGYCKRCAKRSVACLKCGYCYLCHPFKEMQELADYYHHRQQNKITSYDSE